MPIFNYSGYKTDGTLLKGSLEATGQSDAFLKIKTQGIFPDKITQAGIRYKRVGWPGISENFLPGLTRRLSILLSSGVPLLDALKTLSSENKGFQGELLVTLKERVAGGASLSRAMEESGDFFPEYYANMVQAGEQSGNLDQVLTRLADFLEIYYAIKAKVRSAMIYPIFMMGVSSVVLMFLFAFVIPKIVKMFKDTETVLPFITVILIFISQIFIDYWWAILVIVLAAFWTVRRLFKKHRRFVDRMILKLPGRVIQTLYYARFARTLSLLIQGGLPLIQALNLSAKSIGNMELASAVFNAEIKVAEGWNLASALEKFPPTLIQLITTGEKTGRLAETLRKAAESYEEEFKKNVSGALSIFEPVLIMVMGLVVGFIVLAVLLPMFELNQLVR